MLKNIFNYVPHKYKLGDSAIHKDLGVGTIVGLVLGNNKVYNQFQSDKTSEYLLALDDDLEPHYYRNYKKFDLVKVPGTKESRSVLWVNNRLDQIIVDFSSSLLDFKDVQLINCDRPNLYELVQYHEATYQIIALSFYESENFYRVALIHIQSGTIIHANWSHEVYRQLKIDNPKKWSIVICENQPYRIIGHIKNRPIGISKNFKIKIMNQFDYYVIRQEL